MMKTRFAPSPTGFLHLGSVRTALFAWLMARHYQGQFILRIEDTDQLRSKEEYTDLIINTMQWLGLNWDGAIEYQSRRYDRYNQVIDDLVSKDLAYYCDCSPERLEEMRQAQKDQGHHHTYYDGHCRHRKLQPSSNTVVRLKIPQDIDVSFTDEIHGFQQRDRSLLDDWILRRSDGNPTYNFAVVVDDVDMDITHVIRGDDHLNNTSKQVVFYRMMNWAVPLFYHIPMILDEEGARLSKRSGSANILQYRQQGYLPEALLNALARLGWSCGDREIFSIKDLVELFDGSSLQSSPAAFNPEKFHWIAKQWMQSSSTELLVEKAVEEGFLEPSAYNTVKIEMMKKKAKNFQEVQQKTAFFEAFQSEQSYEEILNLYSSATLEALKKFLHQAAQEQTTAQDFSAQLKIFLKEAMIPMKDIAFPLRHIITGEAQWGDLETLIQGLGVEKIYQHTEKFFNYQEKKLTGSA